MMRVERRGGAFSQSPLLCKEGPGEVELLPAYMNHGSPARPGLWMPLPLHASPYKGEETEWRPHKSLKSPKNISSYLGFDDGRECARFVPARDAVALAEAVERFLGGNPALYVKLGMAGLQVAPREPVEALAKRLERMLIGQGV